MVQQEVCPELRDVALGSYGNQNDSKIDVALLGLPSMAMKVFHPMDNSSACWVHQNRTGSLQMTSAKSWKSVVDFAQVQMFEEKLSFVRPFSAAIKVPGKAMFLSAAHWA